MANEPNKLPPCYRCRSQPCRCKDGITLYHADCRDVLPMLEEGSVDNVVTDPPWKASKGSRTHRKPGDGYGVADSRVVHSIEYGDIGYFDIIALQQARRVAKYDMLVHCGYIEMAEVLGTVGHLRGVFVWHNTRPTPISGPVARRDVSFIAWGAEASSVPSGESWPSCLFAHHSLQGGCMATERICTSDGASAHPAQEPIELYRNLIAPLRGSILDPFAGSGTTGRACKDLGRKCIMIEIEERYCKIAARRLEQGVLFT